MSNDLTVIYRLSLEIALLCLEHIFSLIYETTSVSSSHDLLIAKH